MATNNKGRLHGADAARVQRIKGSLDAASESEVIRRALVAFEVLRDFQQDGGQIVLCKQGVPDKVVWFV